MLTALHRCPECSKTFPSDKALHGHMRWHPGRPYRGINPPSNATKRSKAGPTKCLTSCSNSMPKNSHGQYKQIHSFRAELEAFYKDWDREKYYEGNGLQYEARYIRTLDLELYDLRFRNFCKRLISKALEEEEEEGGIKTTGTPTMAMSNGMGSGMSNGMINAAPTTANIATKKRKVNGQHMCLTCKKTFESHQALGGHQTLHRQKTPASSPPLAKEAVEAKTYICKICLQGFSSGQALGGHQRLHYLGPLKRNSAVKGEVKKSGPGSSPPSTHGLLGSAANGDEYEYEEREMPPSPDNLAAVLLEMKMKAEDEDEGTEGHDLEALQSKLDYEVGLKDCSSDVNQNIINEKVVKEDEEKGTTATNQTHVDPRSNHAQQDRNINLPSRQPQLPGMQQLL